ncbi:hypothetical protein JCM33374_g3426 [Metschnikowia sp. JCM 33374]|nr:hypothetical protein JCM33374_g3426 [Metschnikowia sp. JCM 33374]
MNSILTTRQTSELHKAIVQYLAPRLEGKNDVLDIVCSALDTDIDDSTVANYLEKKWSTVLRLQKKILDLENEVGSYKALIDAANSAGAGSVLVSKDKINWLPSSVAKVYPTQTTQIANSVAIHPKLPLVVAGCADGTMIAWNLANDDTSLPQKSWNAHTRGLHRIKWSSMPVELSSPVNMQNGSKSDSKTGSYLLASCSSDLTIKIWEGDSFKHVRTLTGHEHTISSIAFSPSIPHQLYSVSRDKSVKIWDLTNGYCIRTFVGHSDWVRDLDVVALDSRFSLGSPNPTSGLGDFILTCSNDSSIRLSHNSGTGLSMLLGHAHVIETVRFLPMISNIHIDKYITLNLDKFPYLSKAIVENPIYNEALGFKYCISAGRDNVLKLWLLPPPVLLPHRPPSPSVQNNAQGWHILDLMGHQAWVKSVEVHPNGRFIISGADDKTIKFWDIGTLMEEGKVSCVKTLQGHEGFVNAVHFAQFEIPDKIESPEETLKLIEKSMRCLFVSAGTDNTVRIWQ